VPDVIIKFYRRGDQLIGNCAGSQSMVSQEMFGLTSKQKSQREVRPSGFVCRKEPLLATASASHWP
jgi:hypothetical protein